MLVRGLPVLVRPLLIAGCLCAAAAALAQSSGGDFEMIQITIDAGGGPSSGPGFELIGTIAQPEADAGQSAGGEYQLAGGFWASAGANDSVFADGFEDN